MIRKLRQLQGIHIEAMITVALIVVTFLSSQVLIFIPFFIGVAVIVKSPPKDAFNWLIFFLPLSTIIKYSAGSISLFTFWELIYVLKMMVKSKRMPHTKPCIFLYLLYFAYLVVVSLPNGMSTVVDIAGMALPLLCCLFATSRYSDISYSDTYLSFALGTVASNFLGLFVTQIPALRAFSTSMLRSSVLDEFEGVGANVVARFYGIWGDPNILALYSACALGCVTVLFLDHKIRTPAWAVLTAFLVVTGALTVSKTFIVIVAVLILLVIIASFIHHNVRLGLQIIVGVGVLLIVFYFVLKMFNLSEIVESYLFRFNVGTDNQSVDNITSGRASIWKRYFDSLGVSFRFLTGYGMGGGLIQKKVSHNTYIQSVYIGGAFGELIFVSFLVAWRRSFAKVLAKLKTYFVSKNYWMLLLIFAVNIFTLDTFTWDVFFFILTMVLIGGIEATDEVPESVEEAEEEEAEELNENEEPALNNQ